MELAAIFVIAAFVSIFMAGFYCGSLKGKEYYKIKPLEDTP